MELPKHYNPKEAEPKWQKYWEDNKIFIFDKKSKKPVYSIDTPPPYASADHLHVGHAMHYSQFEFVARFRRMTGFNVFFPMGFDDNGLPTERFVEKKYKIDKSSISRSEFIKLCLKETEKVGKSYKKMWSDVGLSVDWSLLYTTISPFCQKIAQKSFIELYKKKRLRRVEEPIMWCTKCQTAIAQADLEDLEKSSKFSDVKFKFKENGSEIIIATTRPELIPACVALFVNPKDKRYSNHVGKKAVVPMFDYEVPILADEAVDMEVGTGFMMVCTWGDIEDVEKWKRHNLDTRLVIDEKGIMNNLAGKYEGMTLKDARKAILGDLEEKGLIAGQKDIQHVTNVHERCNTPIEIFKTPQWFIRVLDKKDELLKQINKINWYPKHMKIRAEHWVQNLKWDWCISRQRFYGIPFPVWYCRKCKEVILPDEKDLPVNPIEQKPKNRCRCGCDDAEPEKDVMDTWMTSSLTPQITLKWGEKEGRMQKDFPMSLRPQAHDIIRTWAFYTIVKAYYHENDIPWKDIMISGHGQDPNGRKMSKRLGNVVTANQAIEKYSADALRFWAASVTLGEDLPYMEKDLVTAQKFITKLWNASKFAIMHLEDYTGEKPKLEIIDRWLISKLSRIIRSSTESFSKYEYSRTRTDVENFFWHEFCDNYLEIIKDRLYNPDRRGKEARKSAQYGLYNTLLAILKMMAPIMPHITEEIYHLYFKSIEKSKSIHISSWPSPQKTDEKAEKAGDVAVYALQKARQAKSEKNLSLKTPLKNLFVKGKITKEEFDMVKDDLTAATRTEKIGYERLKEDSKIDVEAEIEV
ncbi:valine--tRNA ligase [Candidatus Woesearchaeota archaeon]|nr:valine--tRNA ligase [Candidatus Woesearchaeota archaeon]